jgi:hypothetical protein
MACHNGQHHFGARGSEYTTWASHRPDGTPFDKHVQAYQVLLSGVSAAMMKNLGRPGRANEDALCLNCHVVPDHDVHTRLGNLSPAFRLDGVSCESCHGPAEKWLVEHYRPSWRAMPSNEKEKRGWKDTRSLVGRAQGCVACHVGEHSPLARDHGSLGSNVSHDLYAAGHPPLVFEFSSFHAQTAHHWQDAKDKDPSQGGSPDFELHAWLVGQLVSGQASLKLLAERGGRKDQPWPEFADYDCFACHHDIRPKNFRRQIDGYYQGRRPGAMPVRPWHFAMLDRAADLARGKGDPELQELLQRIQTDLAHWNVPKHQVAHRAKQAATRLGELLVALETSPKGTFAVEEFYRTLLTQSDAKLKLGWDGARQLYNALSAVQRTWQDRKATPDFALDLQPGLGALSASLRFPPGFKSPANLDISAFRERLKELQARLP